MRDVPCCGSASTTSTGKPALASRLAEIKQTGISHERDADKKATQAVPAPSAGTTACRIGLARPRAASAAPPAGTPLKQLARQASYLSANIEIGLQAM